MMCFFDRLDREEKLAKTVVYNLNPSNNDVFASMMGNYQDSIIPGKMQFGSGWWNLDQNDGTEKQFTTLPHIGLLSRFICSLNKSTPFLSFPPPDSFLSYLASLIGY